jgi:hypothetical protein
MAMSYAALHAQKYKADAIRGIEVHHRREAAARGHSGTNPDIDWARSGLNYELHEGSSGSFARAVDARLQGLGIASPRKDAVRMAEVVVSTDREWFARAGDAGSKALMRDAYEFLRGFYGEDNAISAIVHMDEPGVPHLHFCFVPVTPDGRLCAKDVLCKAGLLRLHDEFRRDVGEAHGLERGERGGRKAHLESLRYKAREAGREAERLQGEAERMKGEAKREAGSVERLKSETGALEAKRDALAAEVEGLRLGRDQGLALAEARVREASAKIQGLEGEVLRLEARRDGLEDWLPELRARTSAEAERLAAAAQAASALERDIEALNTERHELTRDLEKTRQTIYRLRDIEPKRSIGGVRGVTLQEVRELKALAVKAAALESQALELGRRESYAKIGEREARSALKESRAELKAKSAELDRARDVIEAVGRDPDLAQKVQERVRELGLERERAKARERERDDGHYRGR